MMMRSALKGRCLGTVVLGLSAAALVGGGAWVATRSRRAPGRELAEDDAAGLAPDRGIHVERTVTVQCAPERLYEEWRDLTRWPDLVPIVQSVTMLGGSRSHWVVRGPAGIPIEWDATIVADEPDRLISWRSTGEADVDNAGSVRFTPAPGDRGTEIKVVLTYAPPAGLIGAAAAAVLGTGADRQVREGLRRFKQRMEAREIAVGGPTRDDQPSDNDGA